MHTILKAITLSDGSTAYNVVLYTDGTEITFGMDDDKSGRALIELLQKHTAWAEVCTNEND